jgi:short subunit dehydrogenase-like uncharacterized protein
VGTRKTLNGEPKVLVYGATGFTGQLILEQLRALHVPFVAAGRNEARLRAVGEAFRAPVRVFGLDDQSGVERGLSGMSILLNSAGPFGATTAPLIRGCLGAGAHYLDVSGEVAPLDLASRLDAAARARGIMVLPAVGFDVVPSDCLAVHLARRLPDADELTLSIEGSNLMSRGSALTFAEHAGIPVLARRAGKLEPMRYRAQMRWTNFGDGARPTIATSWGDLVTAYHSTRIPNIEVYFEATPPRVLTIGGNQMFGTVMRPLLRPWFKFLAGMMPEGPSPDVRARHSARIVGEARKGTRRVRSMLVTREAYSFTGIAAAAVIREVLQGAVAPGFQTPGALFGPDFPLALGAERHELS